MIVNVRTSMILPNDRRNLLKPVLSHLKGVAAVWIQPEDDTFLPCPVVGFSVWEFECEPEAMGGGVLELDGVELIESTGGGLLGGTAADLLVGLVTLGCVL